jgi:hypothetical protein
MRISEPNREFDVSTGIIMCVIRKFVTRSLHLIFGDIEADVMGRTFSKHVN